jgi:hypothetical protein
MPRGIVVRVGINFAGYVIAQEIHHPRKCGCPAPVHTRDYTDSRHDNSLVVSLKHIKNSIEQGQSENQTTRVSGIALVNAEDQHERAR